jgi:hypothetical protein
LLLVELLLVIELSLLIIKQFLVVIDEIHNFPDILSDSEDVFVSAGNGLGDVLPFLEEFVSLVMFFLEFLGSLVEFNL